jgi:hypothetical protein
MSGRTSTAQGVAWTEDRVALADRIGSHFPRREPHPCAHGYIPGLLSATERKNRWPSAEHVGESTPDGVLHLLARAGWDADDVCEG